MMLIRTILLITYLLLSGLLYSQTTPSITLPVVTLMDIEPSGNISLSFTAPTEAGRALVNPTPNTTKWINYTSAIAPSGATRRITAAVTVNPLVPGVNIRLQAAAASGAGGGTLGSSSGQVTLTTTPITIISGIGGAYTGNGVNNGHNITISLVPGSYNNITAQTNTVVTITYTITE